MAEHPERTSSGAPPSSRVRVVLPPDRRVRRKAVSEAGIRRQAVDEQLGRGRTGFEGSLHGQLPLREPASTTYYGRHRRVVQRRERATRAPRLLGRQARLGGKQLFRQARQPGLPRPQLGGPLAARRAAGAPARVRIARPITHRSAARRQLQLVQPPAVLSPLAHHGKLREQRRKGGNQRRDVREPKLFALGPQGRTRRSVLPVVVALEERVDEAVAGRRTHLAHNRDDLLAEPAQRRGAEERAGVGCRSVELLLAEQRRAVLPQGHPAPRRPAPRGHQRVADADLNPAVAVADGAPGHCDQAALLQRGDGVAGGARLPLDVDAVGQHFPHLEWI
ncbi:hypothetical protein DIPPA_15432 [Diplonema papillatum]|nr:hypothetical protein DIPPA_15432 [Diplonema papillatum]KAJ9461628.1 hypothetical protein DIPPA_15432 [Diplonema papillatum]